MFNCGVEMVIDICKKSFKCVKRLGFIGEYIYLSSFRVVIYNCEEKYVMIFSWCSVRFLNVYMYYFKWRNNERIEMVIL